MGPQRHILGHISVGSIGQMQGGSGFSVQEIHLALYLTHINESTVSKAAFEEAMQALAWMHRVAGLLHQ